MTNDGTENGSDDSDDDGDTSGSIPLGNVFESLSRLLDRLEELDELDLDAGERRSGNVQRGNATFDYNVRIGSINPAGESRRNRRRRNWDLRGTSDDHEYRVQVNEEDGELVVIADLPAVSADDIDVETNEGTDALEIRVNDEVVESIPLDWDGATVTDVTFRNQILEVHVSPPDSTDENGETDSEGGTAA